MPVGLVWRVPPPQMPSSAPMPVPSTTTNVPSIGTRLGGHGTPRTQRDRSATTWAINEKLPGFEPSNVPQKLPMFVWNALLFTTSSLAIVCTLRVVPSSDPVYVLTLYRDRMSRLP